MYDDKNQLLQGLKNRDLKAYEMIFFKYHARLVLFARKFTGDIEEARDIVQDAFTTLWEKADSLSINDSPKAYLFQAVKNRSLNVNRHYSIKDAVHERLVSKINSTEQNIYDDFNNPYFSLLELELENKIESVIDSMPGKCKQVFTLSRRKHLKNKEIALQLGISVKMVEKHISKALQILRIELVDYISILVLILLKIH